MVHRFAMTLIELLVCIFVIAILLALLLGSLNIAREKAVQIQCFSHLKQVTFAAMNYETDFFAFPGYLSQRPYSDYLTGRVTASAYIADGLLRCPGIVDWRKSLTTACGFTESTKSIRQIRLMPHWISGRGVSGCIGRIPAVIICFFILTG